jgi:hypothetical protein
MSSKPITRKLSAAQPEAHGTDAIVLPEPTPDEASDGSKALTEAAAFAAGIDLSNQQQLNNIRRLIRGDKVETHLHNILMCGCWVVAIGVFASFAVLFWRVLAPENLRFLSENNINTIYKFLFTGTLGGVVTKAGERLMSR